MIKINKEEALKQIEFFISDDVVCLAAVPNIVDKIILNEFQIKCKVQHTKNIDPTYQDYFLKIRYGDNDSSNSIYPLTVIHVPLSKALDYVKK